MKIFLVEGVDGSGKTTLVNKLKEQYSDINVVHTVPRDWVQLESSVNLWQYLLEKIKSKVKQENIVLIDRSFITDFVYRTRVDIGKPSMEFNEFAYLMYTYKLKIIYCNTNAAYVNAKARGENYITNVTIHSNICETYEHFMQTMRMLGIPVVNYDYTLDEIEKLYKKLKEI